MQVSRTWEPPQGTLGRILEETRRRLPSLKAPTVAGEARQPRQLLRLALRRANVGVIAELKRRSPSKGTLNDALNAGQSALFERGGAAAISVLTEPDFFGGSLDDLVAARSAVKLPLLKKDFHIDTSQLVEARLAEASGVLLIARALSPQDLPKLIDAARQLELEPFVEVRSEAELERALEAGAEIIGVNSRDLETLAVDDTIPERLIPKIPPSLIAVWESGIQTVEDVRRAAACGADAVLVGSVLSTSPDAARLVSELSAVQRVSRHARD